MYNNSCIYLQEKRLACERYTEMHEELTGMKGRNEREIQSLREHLRLAMAALQEGQKLGNSLDHWDPADGTDVDKEAGEVETTSQLLLQSIWNYVYVKGGYKSLFLFCMFSF